MGTLATPSALTRANMRLDLPKTGSARSSPSLSWIFTGIYVRWANTTYDGLVKKVRDKIGG